MKIFDISQEVFSSQVYPGDPKPQKNMISSMKKGDLYNLTEFTMCAHNGTHIDVPFHFIQDGIDSKTHLFNSFFNLSVLFINLSFVYFML